VAGLPVREALETLAHGFYSVLQRNRKFVTMVFTDAQRDPELAEALEGISHHGLQMVLDFMDERIERGELRPHDPTISVRLMHHAIIWFFLADQTCGSKIPAMAGMEPETFLRGVVETVLNGIAAPGAAEGVAEHGN